LNKLRALGVLTLYARSRAQRLHLPITAGKLDLGTWQRVFYAEFDGQRSKRVIVKVMGE